MDEDATWYGSRPRSRPHCVRRGPSSPGERGTAAPPPLAFFSVHVYCDHGRPCQLLLSCCCFTKRKTSCCLSTNGATLCKTTDESKDNKHFQNNTALKYAKIMQILELFKRHGQWTLVTSLHFVSEKPGVNFVARWRGFVPLCLIDLIDVFRKSDVVVCQKTFKLVQAFWRCGQTQWPCFLAHPIYAACIICIAIYAVYNFCCHRLTDKNFSE